MSPPDDKKHEDLRLRAAAERQIDALPQEETRHQDDALLHELQVHQIELEMQNEALRQSQIDLSESRDRFLDLYDFAPIGYLTLSTDGLVKEVNLTAVKLLGVERNKVLNRRFAAFVVLEDQDRWTQFFLSVKRPDGKGRVELAMLRANGTEFYAELECVSQKVGPHGATIRIAMSDITTRKQTEAELEQYRHHIEELVVQRSTELTQTEARASHILNSSADGLYGIDAEGRVSFINPAACALLGYTPEQVIGRYPHSLFHHSRPDGSAYPFEECPAHNALHSGQEVRIDNEVYWHADGHPVPLMYAMHPMVQEGKITGAVVSFVDLSEQHAAAEAREHALIAAEKLARLRSEFLANMSHEIRTPLNGVLGFAAIGQRNYQNPEKSLNAFNQILGSGQRLLVVINDILDFSKIEAGKLYIEQTQVNLAKVIGQAVELVDERALAKKLPLLVKLAPGLPKVFLGDPLRLGQVLLNLLTNAIKFTEAGSVTLSASLLDGKLLFRVADTGIGMDAAQLVQLFQPFQQADGSTTRKYGGTGLGLAISKRILELIGGDIRVESQPGQGSSFEFSLPYVPAAPPAEEGVKEGTLADKPLAGLSILAAEDEPVNRTVLQELLEEDGARVVMVGNGLEAVERVARDGRDAYDLVLMDVQMPEMSGYEATRRILALAPDLPIIGQTAYAMTEERARCFDAGMVDHIAKPLDPDALVQIVLQHTTGKIKHR